MTVNMSSIYALKIMAYLYKKNAPCNSRELSENVGISPEFAQNILRRLRTEKRLVDVHMGRNGGYVLGRRPEDIKLADIADAMGGRRLFTGTMRMIRNRPNGRNTS